MGTLRAWRSFPTGPTGRTASSSRSKKIFGPGVPRRVRGPGSRGPGSADGTRARVARARRTARRGGHPRVGLGLDGRDPSRPREVDATRPAPLRPARARRRVRPWRTGCSASRPFQHDGRRSPMRSKVDPNVAACHCGLIQIRVRHLPRTLTSCNCSICRRYGALWAYYKPSSVRVDAPKGALVKYSWNRRIRQYHRCKVCGCVTHYTYRKKRPWVTVGVNASNFEPTAIAAARVRHLDGASTWKFLD